MFYQVRDVCYPTAAQAAAASASSNIGNVSVIGGVAYVTDVTSVSDTAITYTLTGGGSSFVLVSPYTAQPCGLLDVADGVTLGWAVAACWIAAYGVMFLTRGLRGEVTGMVNGKMTCVPSSTSSMNLINTLGGANKVIGNPTAGTDGALPLSSRLPTSGTGNNDGGPSTPLDGTSVPVGSPLPTTTLGFSTGSSGSGSSVGGGAGAAQDTTVKSVADAVKAAASSALKASDLQNIPTDCDKYPNSIGCVQSLDNPTADSLGTKTVNVSIGEDTGWGPTNSSCPAPHTITVQCKTFSMGIQQMCDFAGMIRPVILGVAWFTAALIMLGIGKRS